MPIPLKLTGKIDIPLSDDMLMHYVMSRSNLALKGLVCALKGLKPEQIDSVILNNPIDYGSYAGKEIVLDIKVLLNGGEILDIELQTYYDAYWIERSLYYLSRSYDTLAAGEKYGMLKPITQVSIMNRDLFPTYPEFYSRFLLKNLRYDYPYTSNYALHVLYLNRIELATKQDAQDDLVFWAKLFSAATWEEIYALSRPDAVREQRGSAVKGVRDGVPLVLFQIDFRVHAGKGNMRTVIFPGTGAVESLVIFSYQILPAFRVFPYPFLKLCFY